MELSRQSCCLGGWNHEIIAHGEKCEIISSGKYNRVTAVILKMPIEPEFLVGVNLFPFILDINHQRACIQPEVSFTCDNNSLSRGIM